MVWDATQKVFAANGERKSPTTPGDMLKGKLFDDGGNAMVGSSAHKGERRFRYYVSAPAIRGRRDEAGSLPRVSTRMLDANVIGTAARLLAHNWKPTLAEHNRVLAALHRVELGALQLTLDLSAEALNDAALLMLPAPPPQSSGWIRSSASERRSPWLDRATRPP